MLLIFFGFWYFFIIRPQIKRSKADQAMRSALTKGDEVMILGGLIGRIHKTDEQFVTVEIAKGVTIQIQRASVNTKISSGTYKAS
jgi:preprotein translocase subunit YajC